MSSSKSSVSNLFTMPVSEFQYRQMVPARAPLVSVPVIEEYVEPQVQMSEAEFAQRLAAERAAGVQETEARLRQEMTQRADRETARISKTVADFEQTRKEYFARVESEVVQLALAIAGKILHREAQVDPMLVAAIVQIALTQLKDGAAATLRVRPEEANRWRQHFTTQAMNLSVTVMEDAELNPGDCLLETELGSVNFSLEAQLKEVEQGFLDVLAQKPQA